MIEQRPGAGTAELVSYDGRDDHVASQTGARANNRLDCTDRGNAAAFVIMRAHSPDPSIFEPRPQWIHRPTAHLGTWIHVPVEHQRRPVPTAPQSPYRLPAPLRRLLWMGHFIISTSRPISVM